MRHTYFSKHCETGRTFHATVQAPSPVRAMAIYVDLMHKAGWTEGEIANASCDLVRTIRLPAHNFDHTCSFNVNTGRGVVVATLSLDYEKDGDGIYWALNCGAVAASTFSRNELQERERLANEAPLHNGDVVQIDSGLYTVKVLGPYSDCALFTPVVEKEGVQ